ncbi:MAG: serine/threonine-protein phosphatase [Sphingobacteriaceae bacterium]|nr:MAG: serine/threonine-protein phosphatase [Sphingobacteriaceae bacterium]
MQNYSYSDEDELIRLLLKRQAELNALLEITQAINKNASITMLVDMLEVIMKDYLHVGKFRFITEVDNKFRCISYYGGDFEQHRVLVQSCKGLGKFKGPVSVNLHENEVLKKYDYFIPVFQKNKMLAFALIGDFETTPQMMGNDLNFIQTLTNVIMVALENKKLFKKRIEAERFQREMELAGDVQQMLIPITIYNETGIDVAARYLPHQNIGGDYYDFIRLNEHEFLWCIADVSGKGVSAALLMASLQASLRAWASVEDNLTTIIEKLNDVIIKTTKGEKFITMFLGKFNQQTRVLTYINAGHNPTVVYDNGKITELKQGTTIIGVLDKLPFINTGEMHLHEPFMIFNYTDGLIDYDEESPNWNETKLSDFVKNNGKLRPDQFNNKILEHANRLAVGKPIDDVTLLTISCK